MKRNSRRFRGASAMLFAAFVFTNSLVGQSRPTPAPTKITIKTIKPPGSRFATALGVNAQRQVVGYYADKSWNTHGFLYQKKKGYQQIDFPGSLYTFAMGISNSGEIVGNYQDSVGRHGFTLIQGAYSSFDIPGAQWIQIAAVNTQGWLSGFYGLPEGGSTGFFWDGHTLQDITYPGSGTTSAYGINDHGDIVGQYDSDSSNRDGFLYHDGSYTILSLSGIQLGTVHYIEAIGINNAGDIAGSYIDQNNAFRAFDLVGGSVITVPGDGLRGFGINDNGLLVGAFVSGRKGFAASLK